MTEAGSHRADQLPYYLRLAAASHPDCYVDLTYITGPLTKPAPALGDGQRYSHLTWDQVLPLIEKVWSRDKRLEVTAYVEMISTVVDDLTRLRPSQQRDDVLSPRPPAASDVTADSVGARALATDTARPATDTDIAPGSQDLLDLARATAADGRQRGAGAQDPEALEVLRDQVRAEIGSLSADDETRFVLPWLWQAGRTDGRALTPEGEEFGYELRFSRCKTMPVRP